jgi:electron transport complex protein RnfE
LGSGTFLGISLFGDGYQPWVVMILPPGGFFVTGAWLIFFAWLKERKQRKAAEREEALHAAG